MSGAVSPAGLPGAVPTDWGLRAFLGTNADAINRQLDALTTETSSGLVAQTYGGLAEGGRVALDLQPQITRLTALQHGISAASGPLGTAQTALSEITTIASNLNAQLNSATVFTNQAVTSLAANARDALTQVAGLLDSQYDGQYVFAGQDGGDAPIPDPNGIGGSGFATQIAAAVGGLAANGAAATEASTLAIAASRAPGTSPFSATLETFAASTPDGRSTVEVEAGVRIAGAPLASRNGDVVSQGSSTTGSYARDILRALATVASLTPASANASGFGGLISDTQASLRGAIDAISGDAGALGDRQNALTSQATLLNDTATTLTGQVSDVEDADLAQVSTSLSLAQTKLQASYKLIADLGQLSLVQYL